MKCIHEALRRGALDVLVRCRTSFVDIFPMTFCPLSTTATLVRPSSFMSVRASDSGESELHLLISTVVIG
jgi:hypothetical protein